MIKYKKGVFGVLDTDGMENQPLVLLDGGIECRYQEKYDYYNYQREAYGGFLFQYTLSGSGWFEKNKCSWELSAGRGFLVQFPEKSRYYLKLDSEIPWEFLYLHFGGAAALPFAEKLEEICQKVFFLKAESAAVRQALNLQNRMIRGKQLLKYEGGELLYRFLCALLREVEKPSAEKTNSIADRAIEVMETEYGILEGVEEVAIRLGVSPEHLSRSFREEKGLAPIHFLNRRRIQAAMNELLDSGAPISKIAERNGFANGNYFSKVFTKYVGMSPGEYRKKRLIQ